LWRGEQVLTDAARRAGLPALEVVRAELLTFEEQDREM
jgi:hypothetical protein